MLPKIWKKSFNSGVVIPTKMRFCIECSKEKNCDRCSHQINENKEFDANLNLFKGEPPNEFCQRLPYFLEKIV